MAESFEGEMAEAFEGDMVEGFEGAMSEGFEGEMTLGRWQRGNGLGFRREIGNSLPFRMEMADRFQGRSLQRSVKWMPKRTANRVHLKKDRETDVQPNGK